MSRNFVSGAYLTHADNWTGAIAAPFTVSIWGKPAAANVNYLGIIGNNGTSNDNYWFRFEDAAGGEGAR